MQMTVYIKSKDKTQEFESTLTDREVAAKLYELLPNDNFANSLADSYVNRGWSPVQKSWAHYLVVRAMTPAEPKPVTASGLEPIVTMFESASKKRKYPKIEFQLAYGDDEVKVIQLSRSGPMSKRPGTINVTDGRPFGQNVWYGRIDTDGTTTIGNEWVLDFLRDFAQDPINKAREYGKETGNCCFCGKRLTHDRSVENGFGPICAENYGLTW